VVGLLGTDADPHAVAVACRLGQPLVSRVYLTYLLVVPRNMPLLSALGPEEERAQSALERLDGAVRSARLQPIPRVERTRDPATRLIEVAGEARAEAIVLALPPECPEDLTAVAEALLGRAPCDVVINRLSLPEAALTSAPRAPLVKGGVG
jgi:nucleotide-binding universal stress UspA family protein